MRLVLFLNMGGASSLDECEVFLKNMFNDPYILGIKNSLLRKMVAFIISKSRLKAMQENYKHIGGKSPLNELTLSLCEKLNLKCKESKKEQIFDFVNLYVPPFALAVLQKYQFTQNDELVLFPLYPHHSKTTVTSSLEVLKTEIAKLEIKAKLKIIDVFYKDELYNEMIINDILKTKQEFNEAKTLIFSAHSLPISVIKKGDLYEKQVVEHTELLKEKLKNHFDEFFLSYQSKLGPIKWLEPNTGDVLANLKNKALVYPISFCIDCSESVFELEIEYRKVAKEDYKVIACPNDSEAFMKFILKILENL